MQVGAWGGQNMARHHWAEVISNYKLFTFVMKAVHETSGRAICVL